MSAYTEFIALCQQKELINKLQYNYYLAGQLGNIPAYEVFYYDGPNRYEAYINQTDQPSDFSDFETNYKDLCNDRIEPYDVNMNAMRMKLIPVSGTLIDWPIYFTLGDDESLEAYDLDHWSMTVSTGQTVLRYMPPFHYYLEGGIIRLLNNKPATDILINAIMAPEIPPESGGGHVFIGRRKIVEDYQIASIISTAKYIPYQPPYPTNHLVLTFTHDAADTSKFELSLIIHKGD